MNTATPDNDSDNKKSRKRKFIFYYYTHLPDEWQGRLLRKILMQAEGAPVTVHYIIISETDSPEDTPHE